MYFASLDSLLNSIARHDKIKSYRLDPVDEYFRSVSTRHPVLFSLLRTNSNGKVVNEFRDGTVVPRHFRSIAGQKWYQEVRANMESYYGHIKTADTYYLFWAKPIRITKNGRTAFGGSVAAKINLDKALQNATSSLSRPFAITGGKREFITNNWSADLEHVDTAPVRINGIPPLTMKYVPATQEHAPGTSGTDSPAATPAGQENGTRMRGFLVYVLIGILAGAVVLVLAIRGVVRRKKRHFSEGLHIDEDSMPSAPQQVPAHDTNDTAEVDLADIVPPEPSRPPQAGERSAEGAAMSGRGGSGTSASETPSSQPSEKDTPPGTDEISLEDIAGRTPRTSHEALPEHHQYPAHPSREQASPPSGHAAESIRDDAGSTAASHEEAIRSEMDEEFTIPMSDEPITHTEDVGIPDEEAPAHREDVRSGEDVSSRAPASQRRTAQMPSFEPRQSPGPEDDTPARQPQNMAAADADLERLIHRKIEELEPALYRRIQQDFEAKLSVLTSELSLFADTIIAATRESQQHDRTIIETAEKMKQRISSMQ
jgi:hypothetical protein